MSSKSPREVTEYRLLFQDTGDQIFRMAWPPTREGFIDAFVKPYVGSAIDAYCFCTNVAGTSMFYDSKAGEMYGRDRTIFRGGSALRQHEIIKNLCAAGDDPPGLAVEAARAAGMDCFLRLRMNDLHDKLHMRCRLDKPSRLPKTWTEEPCYYMSHFKRQHPELLLGDPNDNLPKNGYEAWEAMAYNYALRPVREMYYNLAEELVTRYEPDGLQLDFLRFPFFFARHEAYAQRHLLTALLRKIRNCVQEVARHCGHPIHLIADVPETVESALRAGIDTPTWLREGLLDMVTVSRGYYPFSSPWNEVGSLARQAGVPAFACFNHGKLSGWPAGDTDDELGRQTLRAATDRALGAGVQGVFLWNHFYEAPCYDHWRGRTIGFDFTHELVDRQRLAAATKTFELDTAFESQDGPASAHSHTAWKGQVPLTISTGQDYTVTFDLPNTSHVARGQLWLQLIDLHFEDRAQFLWNNQPIQPADSAWPGLCLFDQFEFVFNLVGHNLRSGENKLEIRLINRDPRLEPFITLKAARLTLQGT